MLRFRFKAYYKENDLRIGGETGTSSPVRDLNGQKQPVVGKLQGFARFLEALTYE